jgi:hypothetical protein
VPLQALARAGVDRATMAEGREAAIAGQSALLEQLAGACSWTAARWTCSTTLASPLRAVCWRRAGGLLGERRVAASDAAGALGRRAEASFRPLPLDCPLEIPRSDYTFRAMQPATGKREPFSCLRRFIQNALRGFADGPEPSAGASHARHCARRRRRARRPPGLGRHERDPRAVLLASETGERIAVPARIAAFVNLTQPEAAASICRGCTCTSIACSHPRR